MASPAPTDPCTGPPPEEKKRKKHVLGAPTKKSRVKLSKASVKHHEGTAQTVAATAAMSNSTRAMDEGSLTAARTALGTAIEQKDEAEKQLAESKEEAAESRLKSLETESSVNLARDLTRETEAALGEERGRRIEAEGGRKRAGREEKRVAERMAVQQRAIEEKNLQIIEELRCLKIEKKRLQAIYLRLCRASGTAPNSETEPEEGSIRGLEDQLQLEKFRVSRLESRVRYLEAGARNLREEANTEKQKKRRADKLKKKARGEIGSGGSGPLENEGRSWDESDDESAEGVGTSSAVEVDSLTEEQEHKVMKNVLSRMLKPDKTFGEGAARMFEFHRQSGVSPNATGPLIAQTILLSTGVHLKNDLNAVLVARHDEARGSPGNMKA